MPCSSLTLTATAVSPALTCTASGRTSAFLICTTKPSLAAPFVRLTSAFPAFIITSFSVLGTETFATFESSKSTVILLSAFSSSLSVTFTSLTFSFSTLTGVLSVPVFSFLLSSVLLSSCFVLSVLSLSVLLVSVLSLLDDDEEPPPEPLTGPLSLSSSTGFVVVSVGSSIS